MGWYLLAIGINMMFDKPEPPPKLTQEMLDELRLTTKHASFSDIFQTTEDTKPEVIEDLNTYFHQFAIGEGEEQPCLRCKFPLKRTMVEQLIDKPGGFEWGLAHGHGHCRHCGWPCTLYHFIKDRDGEDLVTIRHILLQVHPDNVELKVKDEKPKAHDSGNGHVHPQAEPKES
jgi:hypothetical protein